ncbi:MAG: T9SS type A sorting domain-containing protein [Crocinitomicaceae bacterium]|nr:T9SS type A sorting domain-containing protein [Crocinitomicaceae bacterium]
MKKMLLSMSAFVALSVSAQQAVTDVSGVVNNPVTESDVQTKTYNACSYVQEGNSYQQGYGCSTLFATVISEDFTVPDGECWYIDEVMASFFTNNLADMTAIDVAIYDDAAGAPGTLIALQTIPVADINSVYDGTAYGLNIDHHFISLSSPYTLCGGVGGTKYWISFQVVCSSASFYWECTYLTTYANNCYSAPDEAGPWSLFGYDMVMEIFHKDYNYINQTECAGYSITVGANTYDSTGNYIDTLTSVAGCDSIVEVDLTIITVDAGVTQTGVILTADLAAASYQWLDCNNAYAVIASGTNQSFTSPSNGNFAVEVTDAGCVDTSACFLIDYTGVEESENGVVTLYPNPSNNIVQLQGITQLQGVSLITITTITGEVVVVYSKAVSEIDLSALSAGVYFVNIQHENGLSSLKLVKE